MAANTYAHYTKADARYQRGHSIVPYFSVISMNLIKPYSSRDIIIMKYLENSFFPFFQDNFDRPSFRRRICHAKLSLSQTLFLLYVFCSGEAVVQHGNISVTVAYPDLTNCTTVQYPRVLNGSGNILVLTSISHEKEPPSVHESAVVWTANVTQNGFRVCVLESGLGISGSIVVNWIAFRGMLTGALHGSASFNVFTSGTKCERVNFAQV